MAEIQKRWEEHVYAGWADPRHVVLSQASWVSLVQSSAPYVVLPDEANGFRVLGMEVHLAPVDDEIFVV